MPRRPDWVGVARRHCKLPGRPGYYCAASVDWSSGRKTWRVLGTGSAELPAYYDTPENAARAYCIHHGLELEVLQTLAPPEEETPDADPQRPSS